MGQGSYDVIVIGLGGMGSAAAYHLARRGAKVLGLEQFDFGHDRGSSHGHTRIIRKAYFEHPDYVPLVGRAFEGWYDLEQRAGRHLLTECPCLSIGPPQGELLAGVLSSARQHGLPVEELSAHELRRRYPPFSFGDDHAGVLERSAGFLYVEDCVRAHLDESARLGATLRANEPASGWEAGPGGVTVHTRQGTYRAGRLVLTAGPWAGALLVSWGACLRVMRQVVLWLGTRDDGKFRRDVFPTFIADTPAGYFYGLPALGPAGLKVARHYGAPELTDPSGVDRSMRAEDEAPVRDFLRRHLPEADGPVRKASVCTYTLTPDRHFLIDLHPEYPRVALAAGFSGHGFKFAPVVGEVLADLAERGRTHRPVGMFRVGRFAGAAARGER